MDKVAKQVLKKQKGFIKDNLCNSDFPQILDKLENKGILTDIHVQQIQAEKTDHGKISKLLYILTRRGPDAFNTFVDSLRPEYDFIAEKLEEEFQKEKDKQIEDDKTDGKKSLRASKDSNEGNVNSLLEDEQTLCKSYLQEEAVPVYLIPNVTASFNQMLTFVPTTNQDPVQFPAINQNQVQVPATNQNAAQFTSANQNAAQFTSANQNADQFTSANQNAAQVTITNHISAKDQPIENKPISSDIVDHSKGATKGSSDRWQPMRTGHSEFIKEITNEHLNYLHTKLKSHLTTRNMRELSFKSPEPVTFAMIDDLIDQLIKEVENCFQALGARDRQSLLTHIISLKKSKKELKEELNEALDLKNKYANALIKQENKNRMMGEQYTLKDKELGKTIEEKQELESTLQDYEKQLKNLRDEVNELKSELKQKENDLEAVKNDFQVQAEDLETLKTENDVLRDELKVLKGATRKYSPQPKKYNTALSRNGGLHYGRQYPATNIQTAETEAIMISKTLKKTATQIEQKKPTQTKGMRNSGQNIDMTKIEQKNQTQIKGMKDSSQDFDIGQYAHVSNNRPRRAALHQTDSVRQRNHPNNVIVTKRGNPLGRMVNTDKHETPLDSLGIFGSKQK